MRGVTHAGTTEGDPTGQVWPLDGHSVDHFGDMALDLSRTGAGKGPESEGDGNVIAVLHPVPHGQLGDLGR